MTFHAISVCVHVSSPDAQPALCSVHRGCRHFGLRDWCWRWHRNCCMCQGCISPAAEFGFHGPFNVVRNLASERSDCGRVRTFHVLYTPPDDQLDTLTTVFLLSPRETPRSGVWTAPQTSTSLPKHSSSHGFASISRASRLGIVARTASLRARIAGLT